MQKVKVVGVGPGGLCCITREALKAISEAGILIGGRRHLKTFAGAGQETIIINNLEKAVGVIRERRSEGIAVLATGDPGMYGVLNLLVNSLGAEEIEVIPGVSSIQTAFARLCMPWHDAVIISAHGRPAGNICSLADNSEKLAVLTGPDNPPDKIYRLLEDESGTGRTYYLCFDLSLKEEKIVRIKSGDSFPVEYRERHNCVMVIIND